MKKDHFIHFALCSMVSIFPVPLLAEQATLDNLSVQNDTLTTTANDLDKNAKVITKNTEALSNPMVTIQRDNLTTTANGEFDIELSQDDKV